MKIGIFLICAIVIFTGGIRVGNIRRTDEINPIKPTYVADDPTPTPNTHGIWLPDEDFDGCDDADDEAECIDFPDDMVMPTPTPTAPRHGIELPDIPITY